MSFTNVSLRPIMGERELAISWLAERGILPTKEEWGRYTLEERDGRTELTPGAKMLIVENLGIATDEDLREVRRLVKDHPRWSEGST